MNIFEINAQLRAIADGAEFDEETGEIFDEQAIMDLQIARDEKLEGIANAHDGVENTYAMQAGREIRVMVQPEKVSDAESIVLAHDIAKEIENEMEYPGQIRVMVIRESRATATAK